MTTAIKFRLTAFALLILLLAVLIGVAAATSRSEISRLQERLANVQLATFQIADHLQTTMLNLDMHLIRFGLLQDPSAREDFIKDEAQLDAWINEVMPSLVSPGESKVLTQIDHAYDVFMFAGSNLVYEPQNPAPAAKLASLDRVLNASTNIFGLATKLEEAHRAVLQDFLTASRKSVALLQQLIFGSLLVLLAVGTWLALTVYREMIAPLRVQLVKSHAIIERQEKLASLGVLAAGVAHEIRNPLTAIKARLFTQQKLLQPGSAELEDAKVIGNEINRLERIVKEVLQFARPPEPVSTTLSAETLLREVRDLLYPQMEKNAIELKVEPAPNLNIRGDAQQLKQVLINLVQNAADSIERNGTITLRARSAVNRAGSHSVSSVVLEVSDTGRGIPPEVQKRLFDPFFSTKEGGTGLGLAIAARIVEKHGGSLRFQTQPNHGTTFGVMLPQADRT